MQPTRRLVLGRHAIPLGGRTLVMGIVNATPDSFFDRGRYFDPSDPALAVDRAFALIDDGADIIDVGGETAQPNSPVLDPDEEIRRIVPVVRETAKNCKIPVSIDTYKPSVARAAIEAGASLINDTSGLHDEALGAVAKETGAGIVVMHIPCHPKERITPGYPDPPQAISRFFSEKITVLDRLGLSRDRILLDPGIGFGKTPQENLELIANLGRLQTLDCALLFACSRRTFLGDLMGGETPEDRLEATAAVNAVAMMCGADVVRVHDVRFFSKMAHMLHLVRKAEKR